MDSTIYSQSEISTRRTFNTKTLYNNADFCDYKQKFKVIIETSMISPPEELSNNIPMEVSSIVNTNNTCAIKQICQFSELFDVNKKNLLLD